MRRVLFLFLDGVGLGRDDPQTNPLAAAALPTLTGLFGGKPLTASTGRYSRGNAHLIPTDAHLGVQGRPQSATGQAAILTGVNAPARLGEHYGPRPDKRVRDILDEAGIFARLQAAGHATAFVNAYPQRYFDAVNRGKRLLSAVPYAARRGGLRLRTWKDMQARQALSANFTGQGWRTQLGYPDVPLYTPQEAGAQFWRLAQPVRFAFLEHWQSDILGHYRDLRGAIEDFERIDGFLAGLLDAMDWQDTLLVVASDHGNVEDCSTRKHTENPAMTVLIGAHSDRYAQRIRRLDDFAALIAGFLNEDIPPPS
ncbi:MAG: hypothetical protein OXH98_16405 [Caldilineaceae bacterium]|nr:hypothetical protein [Caldilineaceae bacterium]MDE0431345.1 hypothetical protein [Caldilineaceae bacterium]